MSVDSSWLTDTAPPSRAWRIRASLAAGLVAGVFVVLLYARQRPGVISDWDPTWAATRALLRGESPYAAIQVPPWPNWLLYPLPALLFTVPFTFIPLAICPWDLRGGGRRGVYLCRDAPGALDALFPRQRRDAVELGGRAVAAPADRGGADAGLLLAAGHQAHAGLRAVGGVPESHGAWWAASCSSA